MADLKNSDVDFVFKTESKSQEAQALFNDVKGLKKHHSIVRLVMQGQSIFRTKRFGNYITSLIFK